MVYLKCRVCEWDGYSKLLKRLLKKARRALKTKGGALFIDPHMTLAYPFPPKVKLGIARQHALKELDDATQRGLTVFHHDPAAFLPGAAAGTTTVEGAGADGVAAAADAAGAVEAETIVKKGNTEMEEVADVAASVAAGVAADIAGTGRIRVGYVSADFKLKATSYLIQNMFTHHDRSKFEIYCYATTKNTDKGSRKLYGVDWRKTIRRSLEPGHFMDVSGKPLEEVVRLVHDVHKIHILVNMDGYVDTGGGGGENMGG